MFQKPKDVKINIVTLGCDKNKVDSEKMLNSLASLGFQITDSESETDVFIINSCGFLKASIRESLDTFFQAVKWNGTNTGDDKPRSGRRQKKYVLTGCIPLRYKNEIPDLEKSIPEADLIVALDQVSDIGNMIISKFFPGFKAAQRHPLKKTDNLSLYDYSEATRIKEGYAFIKIAEGCNHKCAFCAIPNIRGKQKSIPLTEIVSDVKLKADSGINEFILIAQDSTSYGNDITPVKKAAIQKNDLLELSKKIVKNPKVEWLRYLYLHPDHLSQKFLEFIAREPKCVKYIDIPFQHISDNILKKMGRSGNEQKYRNLVDQIRKTIPGVAIRSSFILGFPGERRKDFLRLINFVKETELDKMGLFLYSDEESTKSYNLKNKVPGKKAENRRDLLLEAQKKISQKKLKQLVGKTLEVLVESAQGEEYIGRTQWDAPEVDGQTFIYSKKKLTTGKLVPVLITGSMDYDLLAEYE